jgi:hypothetical protein
MLCSTQQYEEWRGFQGHRYAEHAREFGWGDTCDSVVPAIWRHITYCTNEYEKVARNVSVSSDFTVSWFKLAAKISWLLSPSIIFFLWAYLKSRVLETRPATLGKHQANIREAINDVLQRVMDDFTKCLQSASLHKGGIYCILFSKSEQHMYHTQFPRSVLHVNVSV